MVENPLDRFAIRQRKRHHQIRARQERLVDGLDEVRRRHEQHRRQVLRDFIDPEQHRVRCPMHVDWIGFERGGGAPDREALHLVYENDHVRPSRGYFRNRFGEQRVTLRWLSPACRSETRAG
jgi:hypothetical protein